MPNFDDCSLFMLKSFYVHMGLNHWSQHYITVSIPNSMLGNVLKQKVQYI